MAREIPGFDPGQYSPSECIIPGYIPPAERQKRTVTNPHGGTTIVDGIVPPDEVEEALFESIHRIAAEPINKRDLFARVFKETHIHPDDIDYMLWKMADHEGDSKFDGTLEHKDSWSVVQSRPLTQGIALSIPPREERFWGE